LFREQSFTPHEQPGHSQKAQAADEQRNFQIGNMQIRQKDRQESGEK